MNDHGGIETESYYPGDEYVDWLGLDGYNFGDSQGWSEWESPGDVFGPSLDRMRNLAEKPISFPEFGTSSIHNGTASLAAKSKWITDVYELIHRRDVKMACWFNNDAETDYRVFGGSRGPDRFTTNGRTYRVYNSYRDAVNKVGLPDRSARPSRV